MKDQRQKIKAKEEKHEQIQTHHHFTQNTLNQYNLRPEILRQIRNVTTNSLKINNHSRPSILIKISMITFPNLTYLNLRDSQIHNVEFIQYLQSPKLETLDICENNITNLKSIVKNQSLTRLKRLFIRMNPLKCPWDIHRQNMSLHNQFQFDNLSKFAIEDVSFLAKIPARAYPEPQINDKIMINQKKVIKIIKTIEEIRIIE